MSEFVDLHYKAVLEFGSSPCPHGYGLKAYCVGCMADARDLVQQEERIARVEAQLRDKGDSGSDNNE